MIKIIISPAKKILDTNDFDFPSSFPVLLDKSKILYEELKSLKIEELKEVYKTSDELTLKASLMLEKDLKDGYIHALLAYNGLQYQSLKAHILDKEALEYLNDHLIILSGLYGGLRPFDLIIPYRLEMQSRLLKNGSLYNFWKDIIYKTFFQKDDTIINLASLEYAKVITPYHPKEKLINIHFLCLKNGRLKMITTEAKKGRGAMTRYLAENQLSDLNKIKDFKELSFTFSKDQSDLNNYYFIKELKWNLSV